MNKGKSKGLVVGRRLGNNGLMNKAGRSIAVSRTRTVAVRIGADHARSAIIALFIHRTWMKQRSAGSLASHGSRLSPATARLVLTIDGREARSRGQKGAAPLAGSVGPHVAATNVAGEPWRCSIDVLTPVFDLTIALLLIRRLGCLSGRIFAAQEPLEDDRQDKSDTDDGQDQHQGTVENNLGCNTPDSVGVHRPNLDDLFEALSHSLVSGGLERPSHITAADSLVSPRLLVPQFLKAVRYRNLGLVEPVEQIEIEHIPGVYDQVARAIFDVIP